MLQVSILDGRGEILYNKYIKPDYCSQWDEAERIHHISPADVACAPHIADEMAIICGILRRAKTIVGYNVDFDFAFLEHAGFVVDMEQKVFDVMFAFAEIYGEYNEYYGNYRWQKLSTCAAYYGYEWTGNDVADYVYGQYRLSKAQLHIAGDGAQWIKYGLTIFPKAQYHLDKFHVYKSVTDIVGGDRVLRRQIIDALSESNYERVRALYGARLQSLTKPGEWENVRAGLFYIENNFDEIDLTPATSCAAEGHVSHILSARMSSRPMAWSKDGARRIARLRAYYFNGGDFRDVVADRQQVPRQPRRENTKEKYRRYNAETDGQKGANEYCSAHLVGIDGVTNGLSATLRAILKRGNKKWC